MLRRPLLCLLALTTLIPAATAQEFGGEPREPGDHRPRRHEPPPMLFFTDKIIGLAVDRVVDDMAAHYNLSEDQFEFIREEVRSRFPDFMVENRDKIIGIANQYTEAMLSGEPPSKEFVADWAQTTLPLVNRFAELIQDTRESIRPILSDEQQVQMDGEMAAFQVAMNHVNNRMNVWSQGGYDWESEWPRSEVFRAKEQERVDALLRDQENAKRAARGEPPLESPAAQHAVSTEPGPAGTPDASKPKPADKPGAPKAKDDWEIYVDNFIKRYGLDEAQQNQARKQQISLQEQRDRYARRKLAEIEDLEKRLSAAKTDEDKAELKSKLEKIQQPIDRMFNQLKDKLEAIPTRRQRADAAKTDLEKAPAAKPAESGKPPAAGEKKP